MRKSHRKRPTTQVTINFKANQNIRAPQVRLIDENGQMVGIVSLSEALKRAEESELDLVEVSPKAEPPVCKIIDLGSLKYQAEKEARLQKARQKVSEMKGIRLSLRIGQHDSDIRLEQAKKFLADNNKVKIELTLKGRERQHLDQAREVLNQFIKSLGDSAKIETPFSKQGGRLSLVLAPKK